MPVRLVLTRCTCAAALSLLLLACSTESSEQPSADPPAPSVSKSSAAPPTLRQILASSRTGVARIEATDCEGGVSAGSGFLVAPDLVVTAAHVVRNVHSVALRTGKGVSRGEVVGIDTERDVALVQSVHPFPVGHVFNFSTKPAATEDEVSLLGYPLGLPLTSAAGTIQGLNRRFELEDQSVEGLLQLQLPADHGDSGGPVIDSTGSVVGLLTLGNEEGDQIIYAVPAETAAPLVASWSTSHEPVPPEECDPWSPLVNIESVHPDAPAISATLYEYFASINDDDYSAAWETISGDLRGKFADFDDFAAQLDTSIISDVVIEQADMTNETTDTVDVRFISEQDADLGPDGQDCSRWHVRYTLGIDAGFWTIFESRNLEQPQPCEDVSGE